MEIQRFNDPKLYYQTIEAYLLQEEAVHCMMLGISKSLMEYPDYYDTVPYLVAIADKDRVVATAIKTPNYKLLLSRCSQSEAIVKIARDLAFDEQYLSGVIASEPEATTFAQAWYSLRAASYRQAFALRIHQLEKVESLIQASGYLRQATASDRTLLTSWIQDFEREALGDNKPQSDSVRWLALKLQQGNIYIWEDNIAVSMVAYGGATPNGIRINAVYTPPEYRQKGYATSCVAAMSQKLLEQGYQYCFLYTDISNPTSNSIYQKIGYQPVCDITDYSLFCS